MDRHLRECFEFYDSLQDLAGKTPRTEMALWFHDAVYETIPVMSNEESSANWCNHLLRDIGVFENLAWKISNLILADHSAKLNNIEQQVLADVDLWILAAPHERFKEYDEVQIRNEYKEIPDEIFYPARAKIMKGFLDKKYIYYTPEIRELLEDRARENLRKYKNG
jgi:predicted metal-dependent HD superfamily phosphohydrolase